MVRNICFFLLITAVLFITAFYLAFFRSFDDITYVRDYSRSFISPAPKPFFRRFSGTENIKCGSYFDDHPTDWHPTTRITANLDELEFDMSCSGILGRNYYPLDPSSPEEAKFPLAFARVVYTDYLYIEADLASTYAPQNTYCFAIDAKANAKFKDRIHKLSKCLPNVLYTSKELSIDSGGHNMDAAHFACLNALRTVSTWKYVALLQNHDSAIKTNAEMVQIYRWLDGSNDVELNSPFMGRINNKMDWTFKGLNLFKNSSKNTKREITFAKGYNECSLSREAVDYMFDELNLTTLMANLNSGSYGIDEILIPTLQADDAIGLPGGFTHRCIDEKTRLNHHTRMSMWSGNPDCVTNKWRNSICLLGVEHLFYVENWLELFANKFMPAFDYGAFECMRERLYNKTYGLNQTLPKYTLNELAYKTHPVVRYHRERRRAKFSAESFKCNYTALWDL